MQIIVILSRKDIRQRQKHQGSTSRPSRPSKPSRPGFFVCSLASYKANNCPKIGAMQTANVMEQFSSENRSQRQRMCDFNDDIFKNEIHTKTKYRHEALSRRRRYLKVLTLAFWYLSRRYLINVKSNATQTGPQTWASDPCRITWAVPPAEADSVRCHLKTIALFLSASCFKTNAMENNKNTYEHSNIGYEANEQYYVYATLFKLKASTTFTCHKE